MPGFDHQLTAMTFEEIQRDARMPDRWWSRCHAGGKCTGPSRYWYTWRYVTGRRGRVTTARKSVCRVHAEKIAQKHGIALPEALIREGER